MNLLEFYKKLWKTQIKHLKANEYILFYVRQIHYVLKNTFMSDPEKFEITEYIYFLTRTFYLEQKIYMKWKRFWISKKLSTNDSDLQLSTLKDISSNIIFIDISNKTKYTFTQNDFCQLVCNSLLRSYPYDCEPEPIEIKNPYTNQIFSKKELIEIDKHLLQPPLIWNMYKESKYCLKTIKTKFLHYLREKCISHFVNNLEDDDIQYYLKEIIDFYGNLLFCEKCFHEKYKLRNKYNFKIIISWIEYLKFSKSFSYENKKILQKNYKNPCIRHKPKRCTVLKRAKEIFDSNDNEYLKNIQSYNSIKTIINESIFHFEGNIPTIKVNLLGEKGKILEQLVEKDTQNQSTSKKKRKYPNSYFSFQMPIVENPIRILLEIENEKIKVDIREQNIFNDNICIKSIE